MVQLSANDFEGVHAFNPLNPEDGTFHVFFVFDGNDPGWYWSPCTPGGDIMDVNENCGPFATSNTAYDNALENV